jgi:flagellar hook-length control protein FliK
MDCKGERGSVRTERFPVPSVVSQLSILHVRHPGHSARGRSAGETTPSPTSFGQFLDGAIETAAAPRQDRPSAQASAAASATADPRPETSAPEPSASTASDASPANPQPATSATPPLTPADDSAVAVKPDAEIVAALADDKQAPGADPTAGSDPQAPLAAAPEVAPVPDPSVAAMDPGPPAASPPAVVVPIQPPQQAALDAPPPTSDPLQLATVDDGVNATAPSPTPSAAAPAQSPDEPGTAQPAAAGTPPQNQANQNAAANSAGLASLPAQTDPRDPPVLINASKAGNPINPAQPNAAQPVDPPADTTPKTARSAHPARHANADARSAPASDDVAEAVREDAPDASATPQDTRLAQVRAAASARADDGTQKPHEPAAPQFASRSTEPATAAKSPADGGDLANLPKPAEAPSLQAAPVAPTQARASTPATADTTPVPITGLAVEIAARAQAGRNRFEIRLDPPELGRIDVRLDVDSSGNVTSRLTVDRTETLDALRRDAGDLQRALQDAGLKTSDNGLQFALRDQNLAGRHDQHTPPGSTRIVVPDASGTIIDTVPDYRPKPRSGGGIDIRV